jgi:hypothetical protein
MKNICKFFFRTKNINRTQTFFCNHRGLVLAIPKIPKSTDAQALDIKW